MRPARIGAAFEVIEAEVVFEFAILLFDGPAAARERDEVDQGGRGRRGAAGSISARRSPSARTATTGPRVPSSGATRSAQNRRSAGRRCPCPTSPSPTRSSGAGCAMAVADAVAGHPTTVHVALAANRHAIARGPGVPGRRETRVAAVVGIDHDAREREARLQNRADLRQRDAPLLAKLRVVGNAGRGAARRIVGPRRRGDRGRTPTATCVRRRSAHSTPATWQLPILPSAPQYCRCTPTERVPCLGNPVSSMARMPARTGTTARNCAQTRRGVPRANA